MGGVGLPTLKDIVDAMEASWPAALAIFIASSAVLISGHLGLTYLETLPDWFPGAVFLAAVASGSILFVAIFQSAIGLAMRSIRVRRYKAAETAHLETVKELPPPEIALLAWAVANRTQVFTAPYFNPHVKALIAKGILTIPGGHHHTDETPLFIPDHIWKALKEDAKDSPHLQQLVGLKPFSH